MRQTANKGFSLVELLVVMAIIAILASMLMPALFSALGKAREIACMSNLRQMGMGLMMSQEESDDSFPSTQAPFVEMGVEKLRCPQAGGNTPYPYLYNAHLAGYSSPQVYAPSRTIVAADGKTNDGLGWTEFDIAPRHRKGYGGVLFADGSVQYVKTPPLDMLFLGHHLDSLTEFTTQFNVPVVNVGVVPLPAGHAGDLPDAAIVASGTPGLLKELSIYPTHLFRPLGANRPAELFDHLVLVSNLRDTTTTPETPLGGLATYSASGAALSGYTANIFVNMNGDPNATVHHEIYHTIDFLTMRDGADAAWDATNPPGTVYGNVANPNIMYSDAVPGFVDSYAQVSPLEDKAEVYRFMITQPATIAARCQTDTSLQSKVTIIKARCLAVCPELDDVFWQYIQQRPQ